jgi:transcriptional regulator with XRE-family HTH domain
MTNEDKFSNWLQQELSSRKWDQAELTRYGGVTASQVSRIIAGQRKPGVGACRAIATALGLPPEEIFRHAGLLPRSKKLPEGGEELLHYYAELSADDRQRAIAIVRALWELTVNKMRQ